MVDIKNYGLSLNSRIMQHEAFKGVNCGCCTKMTGKMAIVSVLVSDIFDAWSKSSIDEYMSIIQQSVSYILSNGGREAGLAIPLKLFYRCNLKYRAVRSNYKKIAEDVLLQLGYNTICDLRDDVIKNNPQINSVAVLFIFNCEARSFALKVNGRKNALSTRRNYVDTGEYAFIYFKNDRFTAYTICHEIFHLYGAIDYYRPDVVKREAEKYFPNSIMLCYYERKPCVDNLTRVLIGWEESLNSNSLSFLNNTLCTRRKIV